MRKSCPYKTLGRTDIRTDNIGTDRHTDRQHWDGQTYGQTTLEQTDIQTDNIGMDRQHWNGQTYRQTTLGRTDRQGDYYIDEKK